MDELHVERPNIKRQSRPDLTHFNAAFHLVLDQLGPGQCQREWGPINGCVNFIEDVRQRANVVLVAVGENDTPDPVTDLAEICDVWNDDINPGKFGVREHHATIDYNRIIAILEDHHVDAELAEASEGNGP